MSKTTGARCTIAYFKNRPGESFLRCYVRYKELLRKCPHHGLPNWYVLYVFYGGLNEANKIEIYMASRGSFLDFTITEACKLLDTIRQTREAWSSDLGDKRGIKIEHDCIKAFVATGEVDELAEKHHIDTYIVLHVLQAVAEQIKAPKK